MASIPRIEANDVVSKVAALDIAGEAEAPDAAPSTDDPSTFEFEESVHQPTLTWPDPPAGDDQADAPLGTSEVFGDDQRVRVRDVTKPPWKWICHLEIEFPHGTAVGTGFLIGNRAIVTAGHNIVRHGGWRAIKMTVRPQLSGNRAHSRHAVIGQDVHPGWESRFDWQSDVGCVFIQEPIGAELGFFSYAVPDNAKLQQLKNGVVNCAGYDDTGKQPPLALWHSSGAIASFGDAFINYTIDTSAGQSGSPVFHTSADGARRTVLGVHGQFIGRFNRAVRITPGILDLFSKWAAI